MAGPPFGTPCASDGYGSQFKMVPRTSILPLPTVKELDEGVWRANSSSFRPTLLAVYS
jgi:hypothetical protein